VLDYVVVGAGSAGCVLAARLSENPAADVLLLEAGGPDAAREIRIPAAFSKLFRSDVDWNYDTSPEPELAGRSIYWPRGKMLGGSSSMNAMMAIPGSHHDYEVWPWSWSDVAPVYERVREDLQVEELRDPNPLTLAFVEAAQQLGIPPSSSLGPTDLEGVRITPVTQRRGRRNSSADAYLRPALKRPNLTVRTGAHVTRVVVNRAHRSRGRADHAGDATARPPQLVGGCVSPACAEATELDRAHGRPRDTRRRRERPRCRRRGGRRDRARA
jgi:choline dehydrogenase